MEATSLVTTICVIVLTIVCIIPVATGQSARKNGGGTEDLNPVQPGDPEFRQRKRTPCSASYRTFDGSCTSVGNKMWGSSGTPVYSYQFRHSSKEPTGTDLPSPRFISNLLCSQNDDVFSSRGLSELVVFFGQFIDHNIVATVANPNEPMHIEIPPDDPVFGNTTASLHFVRNLRGIPEGEPTAERPINILSSAFDLVAVYGADQTRAEGLRTFHNGMLKTSPGNLLPYNVENLFNAPTSDTRFFVAGDHRANEHPVLTSLHTLFVREHNRLAVELNATFPDWNDDQIYNMSRMINWSQFQKIVFEEWLPVMTGRRLRRYTKHRKWTNPAVSDVFSTAAFRLGHTLVGNSVSRMGSGNYPMPKMEMKDMFFVPWAVANDGIDPFLRGSVQVPAQEVDVLVHSSIRNFLFSGVPEEKGFDLIALNLQRSRDHAIPPYNIVRRLYGLREVHSFSQITRNVALQSKLQSAYGTVDRVEAWIGLMAEDHVAGASMGRTMLKIWMKEFTRMRTGDRFFYEQKKMFPPEVVEKMPWVEQLKSIDNLMRKIIVRNTDITDEELPLNIWKL